MSLRTVAMIMMLLVSASVTMAFTCEQDLVYCRQTLNDVVTTTHFDKGTSQDDIVKWWERKWIQGRPNGIMRVEYSLEDLVADKKDEKFATYILPGDKNISVTLQIPVSEPVGEKFPAACLSNTARLKTSADDPGFSFDLNPYCSESYGPHEVGISLYWYSIREKPIVAIETNGPACVPAMLYGFNKEKRSYELVSEKCGG